MSAIRAKKIVVVGGGPGGLTLGRLLQIQGAEVRVYERDADRSVRVQGSALDLHEGSGLAALQAASLMDGFWALHRPELNRLRLVNWNAEILYDFPRGQGSGVHRPEIERAPLRNLLLDSLEPETVCWNKKLDRAADEGERIRLYFTDGESDSADLVIGADGANSRLRSLLTPIRPEYAGVTLVEGTVPQAEKALPELSELLGGAALIAFGAEKTLAMATKSDGSLLFYAGLKAPGERAETQLAEARTADERVAWFRDFFPEWSRMWEPLFAHALSLVWRPQLRCPADQHWEARANITLIGDAAHVMPPYAGEGVNMAMLDALVLSRELGRQADTRAAIAAYQEEMFARTARTSAETMSNTELFYEPDADAKVVAMFKGFAAQAAAQALPVSDLPN